MTTKWSFYAHLVVNPCPFGLRNPLLDDLVEAVGADRLDEGGDPVELLL